MYSENYKKLKKKLKKIQISENTYCVHGEEELTSLQYLYYPKQSIDSMQFLSRYQWHISQNQKNIPKIYIEPQKAPHINSDPEKKEQSQRNHATKYQTIL